MLQARKLHEHLIGRQGSRASLNTPALIVDLSALERNIAADGVRDAVKGLHSDQGTLVDENVEELDFDRAEFKLTMPSAVACLACKEPVEDAYFQVNGQVLCAPCLESINLAAPKSSRPSSQSEHQKDHP